MQKIKSDLEIFQRADTNAEIMKGYYDKVLKELKERVDRCDIDTLNSLDFFLREANIYTISIPRSGKGSDQPDL